MSRRRKQKVRAGRLDRRVMIQTLPPGYPESNAAGLAEEDWQDWKAVWAERRDLKGSERYEAQALIASVETEWRIRWMPGVTAETKRLRYEDATYEIRGVTELGRREGLVLLTERKTRNDDD